MPPFQLFCRVTALLSLLIVIDAILTVGFSQLHAVAPSLMLPAVFRPTAAANEKGAAPEDDPVKLLGLVRHIRSTLLHRKKL